MIEPFIIIIIIIIISSSQQGLQQLSVVDLRLPVSVCVPLSAIGEPQSLEY